MNNNHDNNKIFLLKRYVDTIPAMNKATDYDAEAVKKCDKSILSKLYDFKVTEAEN